MYEAMKMPNIEGIVAKVPYPERLLLSAVSNINDECRGASGLNTTGIRGRQPIRLNELRTARASPS